jgi:hypothetical protein
MQCKYPLQCIAGWLMSMVSWWHKQNWQTNRAISNIEAWTDAFISYSQILLERHPQKANELYAYMVIIRSAEL